MRENIISSKNNTSKHSAESPRFGNDNTNIISTFDTYEKADVVPDNLETKASSPENIMPKEKKIKQELFVKSVENTNNNSTENDKLTSKEEEIKQTLFDKSIEDTNDNSTEDDELLSKEEIQQELFSDSTVGLENVSINSYDGDNPSDENNEQKLVLDDPLALDNPEDYNNKQHNKAFYGTANDDENNYFRIEQKSTNQSKDITLPDMVGDYNATETLQNEIDNTKKKFEDLSQEEKNTLWDENRALFEKLQDESNHRIEAEYWGLSVDEYLRIRKDNENNEKLTKSESKILDLVSDTNSMLNEYRYMYSTNKPLLTDLPDSLSNNLDKLREEKDKINIKISEKHNKWLLLRGEGKDFAEYCRLEEEKHQLKVIENHISIAIEEIDAFNFQISNSKNKDSVFPPKFSKTNGEYKDVTGKLTDSEINRTFKAADSILKEGISNKEDVISAYQIAEKLQRDIVYCLTEQQCRVTQDIASLNYAQKQYLREHNCTHEDNLLHTDRENTNEFQTIQIKGKELSSICMRITEAVDKSIELYNQLSGSDSSNWTRVIKNNPDGTVTITETWNNKGATEFHFDGQIHNSEITTYNNAINYTKTTTFGRYSGNTYTNSSSFQYRILGLKWADTWIMRTRTIKNKFELGLGNLDFSHERGRKIREKRPECNIDITGNIFQIKDTLSYTSNGEEHTLLNAKLAVGEAYAKGGTKHGLPYVGAGKKKCTINAAVYIKDKPVISSVFIPTSDNQPLEKSNREVSIGNNTLFIKHSSENGKSEWSNALEDISNNINDAKHGDFKGIHNTAKNIYEDILDN